MFLIENFAQALLAGDEEKALQLYLTVTKGNTLQEDLNPSAPFPIQVMKLNTLSYTCLKINHFRLIITKFTKIFNLSSLIYSYLFHFQKYSDQTPLHLAAASALKDIIVKFLEYGGSPSVINAKGQTSLHSVCSKSDKAELRNELLNMFMQNAFFNIKI